MKKNGLKEIVILVCVLVAGISLFFIFTKNKNTKHQNNIQTTNLKSDQTSNWKTFINTKYEYSVKYPPTSTVSSLFHDKYPNPAESPEVTIDDNYSFKYLIINVDEKQSTIMFKDFVTEKISNFNEQNMNVAGYKPLIIIKEGILDEKQAFYVSNNENNKNLTLDAYIEKDPKTLLLIHLGPVFQGQEKAYTDYFYSIVNTIKFTNNN